MERLFAILLDLLYLRRFGRSPDLAERASGQELMSFWLDQHPITGWGDLPRIRRTHQCRFLFDIYQAVLYYILRPPIGGYLENFKFVIFNFQMGGRKEIERNKKNIINRLHYAEGHLKAVCKMIENDAYCMDIINQNHAVIEALRKINQLVLEGHLGVCAYDAVNSKNSAQRKKAITELVNLYSKNS